jgi:6-pyruvoyltetrahydropterin/6-carboxytetrahydropterin synthase
MLNNCTLTKIYSFSAAHRLHNDKFTEKENKEIFGKCNNPNGHGHDYSLELTLGGEIEYFTSIRASGENIAKYLWDKIVVLIPRPAYLYHVRLWETSENFFDYKDVS